MSKSNIFLISIVMFFLSFHKSAIAGDAENIHFLGFGLSSEYGNDDIIKNYTHNNNKYNDAGLSFNFKFGMLGMFYAAYIFADFGYRFNENKILYRLGGETLFGAGSIFLVGPHVAVFHSLNLRNIKSLDSLGLSVGGVIGAGPFKYVPQFTIFLGSQLYGSSPSEFVLRVTITYCIFPKDYYN